MNIQEDYVSFEIAKLLKEKGYKGSFNGYYNGAGCVIDSPSVLLKEPEYQYYERVSLYMAVKWLREKHNIHIEPRYFPIPNIYRYVIIHSPFTIENINSHPQYFNTHEEACDAAIKYCLQNLIK